MANNQFINLEELSKTTQALLSKINEQSNLKVNKANVSAELNEGIKIGSIEDVEIYAPEIDTSNFITWDDDLNLAQVAYSGSYNDLNDKPSLATVATSGNYNDLSNKPTIPVTSVNGKTGAVIIDKVKTGAGQNAWEYSLIGTLSNATHDSPAYIYGPDMITFSKYTSQYARLTLGNSNTPGVVRLYSTTNGTRGYTDIQTSADPTTEETITFPNASGTVALISDVNSAIATAIGNINQFEVAIVTDLPTTDIDTHTIYFKSNSSSGNNVYDEYMYINSNWELIGSTQIDLTPYALSANLATVATSGDYDDLTDAPIAETDTNVEDMLDSFDLDYTSNSSSPNYATGVNF